MKWLISCIPIFLSLATASLLCFSTNQASLTLSSGSEQSLQTLITSGQSLIHEFKEQRIPLKQIQIRAYQDYNALEKVLETYKTQDKKVVDTSLLDLGDYVLLQLSCIFKLQTTAANKIERFNGAIRYLSYLWVEAKKLSTNSLHASAKAFIRSKSWAAERFTYIIIQLGSLLMEGIATLLVDYTGYRATLKHATIQFLSKEYDLHGPTPETAALVKDVLEKSGIKKDIVILEGDSHKLVGRDAIVCNDLTIYDDITGLTTFLVISPKSSSERTNPKIFNIYRAAGHIYYSHLLGASAYSIYQFLIATVVIPVPLYIIARNTEVAAANLILYSWLSGAMWGSVFGARTGVYLLNQQEKEADMFACEQLTKLGKADIVLAEINKSPTNKYYLLECLFVHKDKIASNLFENRSSLLFKFFDNNDITSLNLLLSLGTRFDCEHRFSPLAMAIIFQRFDIVQLYLNHGITLETCHEQDPVILYALAYNKPKVRELAKVYRAFASSALVQKALRLNTKIRPDHNSLSYLARSLSDTIRNNQKDLLALLLKYGADPNINAIDGSIPFGEALVKRDVDPEVVRLLLAHGANTRLMYQGKSALTLAQETGNEQIIALIKESFAQQAKLGPREICVSIYNDIPYPAHAALVAERYQELQGAEKTLGIAVLAVHQLMPEEGVEFTGAFVAEHPSDRIWLATRTGHLNNSATDEELEKIFIENMKDYSWVYAILDENCGTLYQVSRAQAQLYD